MIIIFGQRWKSTPFGQLELQCSHCSRVAFHTAQLFTGRFTLFFVPTIPLYSQYYIVCNVCGNKRKAVGLFRAQLEKMQRTGYIPKHFFIEGEEQPKCRYCQHQGSPLVQRRIATRAWIYSGCFIFSLFLLPVFWIPLVIKRFKNEIYKCESCSHDLI